MEVKLLNQHYLRFKLNQAELDDEDTKTYFLAALKSEIPGDRKTGKAMRFYLKAEKCYCIHRSYVDTFIKLAWVFYKKRVTSPFIQEELF